jgi:murein DD-endopeptidase MepM/ murein hydrolase activator NlpD
LKQPRHIAVCQRVFTLVACVVVLASCATTQKGRMYYMVTAGTHETLDTIARRFDTTPEEILAANNLDGPEEIKPGIRIKVYPGPEGIVPADQLQAPKVTKATPSRGLLFGNASGKIIWPVSGEISSAFGRRGWRSHTGVDIRAPKGTEIAASADGVVVFAGWKGDYGKLIEVKHDSIDMTTIYAHCHTMDVKEGSRVKAGEIIGTVGRTGNATGPHLHFEVRNVEGEPVDPLSVLGERGTRISSAD